MLNRAVVVKDVMLDAEHAKFGPSTDSQPGPTTLLLATGLMRMVSLCCGRAGFPQRSRMLLRSMHLLRHILAACPVTPLVRTKCLVSLPAPFTKNPFGPQQKWPQSR